MYIQQIYVKTIWDKWYDKVRWLLWNLNFIVNDTGASLIKIHTYYEQMWEIRASESDNWFNM